MKIINTPTEVIIMDDKIVYTNNKHTTVSFNIKEEETYQFIGFSKVEIKDNKILVTK